ncbi:MAG: hypothetical protein P1V36_06030 [Planctomycetota bacterium]|nr:hypothetical protein [Planctomycetota bacterium]
MSDSSSPPPPESPGGAGAPEPLPELVVGRGKRLVDYALRRLRASRALQVSAVLAVVCYGALPFLVMYPDAANPRLHPFTAALMVLMSLASWTLLFWWYPVFEHTQKVLGDSPKARIIARTLESVAIGCVVVVHGLMAYIIVQAGVTS